MSGNNLFFLARAPKRLTRRGSRVAAVEDHLQRNLSLREQTTVVLHVRPKKLQGEESPLGVVVQAVMDTLSMQIGASLRS